MGWRFYTPEDKSQTDALHARMEARLRTSLDLPQLDERPVLISLVYEQDGVITHSVFIEAVAEVSAMGERPLPRAEWDEAARKLREVCEKFKLRIARAYVPQEALESKKLAPIERILRYLGFEREDVTKLVPFSKWLA